MLSFENLINHKNDANCLIHEYFFIILFSISSWHPDSESDIRRGGLHCCKRLFLYILWCNHHCTLLSIWVNYMILYCCSMRFFKNIFDGLLSSCRNSCVMSENCIFCCCTWRYHGSWYIVTWSDSDTLRIGGQRVCVQSEYTL